MVCLVGLFCLEAYIPPNGSNPWNPVLLITSLFAIVMMAFEARRGAREQPRLFFVDAVLVTYFAYCFLSAAWSPDHTNTLLQASLLAVGWLASVALRTVDVRAIVVGFVWLALIIAVASFVVAPLSPTMAFQPGSGELRGVLNHQLRLGMVMTLALCLLALLVANRDRARFLPMSRGRLALVVVVLVVCLAAAQARLYTFFGVLALVLTIAVMWRRWTRVLALAFVTTLIVLIYVNAPFLISLVAGGDPTDTLTGRTVVWSRTQVAIDEGTPWGYGFASFGSDVFAGFWGAYRAPHAHNSFLQAQFETGVIGFVLVVLMLLTQLWSAYRAGRALGRVPYSLLLVASASLGSLTGLVYASKPNLLLMVSFLALVSEMQEARGVKDERERYRLHAAAPRRESRPVGRARALTLASTETERRLP